MGCQSWQILWYLNFINFKCINACRNLRLRDKLPGSLQHTAEAECLMRWAIVFWQKRETTFSTFSLVLRRVGPFLPHQKKSLGLDWTPHEFRILPDGCLCSGDQGWAVLTTKLDVHNCQQNRQAKAASPRCHQRPARRQQLQELKANTGSVMSLASLSWKHRGSPKQGLPGLQDRLPVPGTSFGRLESDGGGRELRVQFAGKRHTQSGEVYWREERGREKRQRHWRLCFQIVF